MRQSTSLLLYESYSSRSPILPPNSKQPNNSKHAIKHRDHQKMPPAADTHGHDDAEREPCLSQEYGKSFVVTSSPTQSTTGRSSLLITPTSTDDDVMLQRPGRGEEREREDEEELCFRLDACNACMVGVLLCTLLIAVALVAFVMGTYIAAKSQHEFDLIDDDYELTTTNRSVSHFNVAQLIQTLEREYSSSLHSVYPPARTQPYLYDSHLHGSSAQNITRVHRLPANVRPTHYDLYLDLTRFAEHQSIWGIVKVNMQVLEESASVVLHAATGLTIARVLLTDQDNLPLDVTWTHDTQRQWLVVKLSHQLLSTLTQYRLLIKYQVKVSCQLDMGFMCMFAQKRNGHPVHIEGFTTKFEPALAKTAMPCWDEPQLKAIFNVSLRHSSDQVAISNTAAYTVEKDEPLGQSTTYFLETPPMSTYLLTFALGDFRAVRKRTARGLPFALYCRPPLVERMSYAADFAVRTLDRMEEHFKVKYPLAKLDFVATPYYAAAAMENWGLAVFSERLLMVTPSESTLIESSTEERNALRYQTEKIIIHELLHQWFGNLVTLRWWDDVWLNEGITTHFIGHFFSEDLTDHFQTNHMESIVQLWQQDVTDERASVYQANTANEQQLDALFTSSVYDKGATLTGIMRNLMGNRTFEDLIVTYLRRFQYKNVQSADLFSVVPEVHFANVSLSTERFMSGWLHVAGMPELTVTRHNQTVRLAQTRADLNAHRTFLVTAEDGSEPNRSLWMVPVTLVTDSNQQMEHVLKQNELTVQLPMWNGTILANPNIQFPIRVNYDDQMWRALASTLLTNMHLIPPRSRVQLILDAQFFLMHNARLTLHVDLLSYLLNETDQFALLTGIGSISDLLQMYESTDVYPLLLSHFRPLIAHIKHHLHRTAILQSHHHPTRTNVRMLHWLYCVSSAGHCAPLTVHALSSNMDTIHMGDIDRPKIYELFQRTCHSLSYYSSHYGAQIEQILTDLQEHDLHGAAGKSLDNSRLHLALCAASQNETILSSLSQMPHLVRGWSSLLVDTPYLLSNHRLRLAIWKALAGHPNRMPARQAIRCRLVHSIQSMAEWQLAAGLFDRVLYSDLAYVLHRLHWVTDMAVPLLKHHLRSNNEMNQS